MSERTISEELANFKAPLKDMGGEISSFSELNAPTEQIIPDETSMNPREDYTLPAHLIAPLPETRNLEVDLENPFGDEGRGHQEITDPIE